MSMAMNVEVVERRDAPGVWSVEATDHGSDGEVLVTLFHGPRSKQRAVEYAEHCKAVTASLAGAG